MPFPIPSYRDIVDLIKKGATIEAQEKIMELREACIALEDESHDLKGKIKVLEEALRFKEALEYRTPFYFAKGDDTPFCPRCWEKDRCGIHLNPERWHSFISYRDCPECEAAYKVREADVTGKIK